MTLTAVDVHLDLETFDTAPTAFICAIGLALVESDSQRVLAERLLVVDPKQDQPGRTISPDTVAWWLGQPRAARDELLTGTLTLAEALAGASDFLAAVTEQQGYHLNRIWACDPDFDVAILRHAAPDLAERLAFHKCRSIRTVGDALRQAGRRRPRTHAAHCALEDVRHQCALVAEYHAMLDEVRA